MKHIAAAWEAFKASSIPCKASETQVKAMKVAYYQGWIDAFDALASMQPDEEAEELSLAAQKQLDDITQEIKDWEAWIMASYKATAA